MISETNTSRFVRIEDKGRSMLVHYHDCNPEGESTVVMLHGSGPGATGWSNFSRNIEPLVAEGYRVVLLDCPGWGKSEPIVCRASRSDLNARVLALLINQLSLEKVHLIGNSMGAHSAVAFSLLYPDRLGKLVLMGGGIGGKSSFVPMPTEGIKLLQGVYREPDIHNLKRMMDAFVFDGSSMTEQLFQERLQSILNQPEHLKNFVESLAANPVQFPDYGSRLGEINSPTLVIWGRDDRFVPLDIGLRLIAALPKADLHVFNRCGHWAQWEHAEKFNRLVRDFLANG